MKTLETCTKTDRPVGLLEKHNAPAAHTRVGRRLDPDANPPAAVAAEEARQLLASARREAEALAWTTPFPALFLPALLEEKVDQAFARAAKQGRVRQQTSQLWNEPAGVLNAPPPPPEPDVDGDSHLNR